MSDQELTILEAIDVIAGHLKAIRQRVKQELGAAADAPIIVDRLAEMRRNATTNMLSEEDKRVLVMEAIEQLAENKFHSQVMALKDELLVGLGLQLLDRRNTIQMAHAWLVEQLVAAGRAADEINYKALHRYADRFFTSYRELRRDLLGLSPQEPIMRTRVKEPPFKAELTPAIAVKVAEAIPLLNTKGLAVELSSKWLDVICPLLADTKIQPESVRNWLERAIGRRVSHQTFTALCNRFDSAMHEVGGPLRFDRLREARFQQMRAEERAQRLQD